MLSRFRNLPMILALVVGALAAQPARAQLTLDPQRVQDAIDVTDRRIQQARDLLAGAPNPQAAAEAAQAVSLQAIAKQNFARGFYGAAARATFDARTHADRAIAILQGLPDPVRVQDQLARTRELLDRARDRLSHCELPVVRDMLRTAIDMQARAELAYSETRYRAALPLPLSAAARRRSNGERCLNETVNNGLKRRDATLPRAQELVGSDASERPRQMLANAD